MPPAVQDSEDEDEILLDDDPSQRSTFSQMANHAESVLEDFPHVMPQHDAPADKPSRSTSSSDLRRQVADAERGLLATNSGQASKHASARPSSTSPALQRNKRRSTLTVLGSDAGGSPVKSLKRVKTYAQNRSFLDEDDERPRSPIGLPGGKIGNYFAHHEPNVMFRDTGTTNAFNDSTQEELVEQARSGNNAQNTNVIPPPKTSNSDESSSFPWTASAEPTQTEKSPAGAKDQDVQGEDAIRVQKVPSLVRRPTIEPLSPVAKRPAFFQGTKSDPSNAQEDSTAPAAQARAPPKSSPVVIIDRRDAVPRLRDDTADNTQEAKRARKRKSQEAAEEPPSDDRLDSDDRVLKELGLHKEQYKPRLSRRRATQVEETLDNSLTVEKATRKRRKTENAAAEPRTASQSRSQTRSRDGLYECPLGCSLRMREEEVFLHLDQCPTKLKASPLKTVAAQDECDTNGGLGPQKKDEESTKPAAKPITTEQSPKQPSRASSVDASPSSKTLGCPSSEKKSDVGLMLPPTIPASASKRARRSKTTIFEDHVEFDGSQKSPTLSQQQASRKVALKEVKNGSAQKARRKIVQDDDDDEEDELAKEEVKVKQPAQKKGRGRPPTASIQKPANSTERILEDSDAEDDEDEIEREQPIKPKARGRSRMVLGDSDAEDDNDSEADGPPVKKRRGRPSKAKPAENNLQDSALEHAELEKEPVAKKGRGRPAKAKFQEKELEDSDAEEEVLAEVDEDDAHPDQPPKKKRRGRPSKAKASEGGKASDAATEENSKVDIPSSDLSAVNKGDSSPTKAALSRKHSDQPPKATELQSPRSTPPEEPHAKLAPATHSPIKSITKGNGSGSFPTYRVGLSKTRKIPSLLKIVGKPRPDARR